MNLRISFSISATKAIGILIQIESVYLLGSIEITTLTLPIHKHGVSSHLFRSFIFFSAKLCNF